MKSKKVRHFHRKLFPEVSFYAWMLRQHPDRHEEWREGQKDIMSWLKMYHLAVLRRAAETGTTQNHNSILKWIRSYDVDVYWEWMREIDRDQTFLEWLRAKLGLSSWRNVKRVWRGDRDALKVPLRAFRRVWRPGDTRARVEAAVLQG